MNIDDLNAITGNDAYDARKRAYLDRLNDFGGELVEPHILAQITAQVLHESGRFRYAEEIASGVDYEGRADLGNIHKGDGVKFKGRDFIQVTGRSNYDRLSRWVSAVMGRPVDFVANPSLLTSKKWLGIGVVWYFLTRKGLLGYCRDGDIEMVTRLVNGGLNGYEDRLGWYDKTALQLLGYPTISLAQADLDVMIDGISGPKTRAAMHAKLRTMGADSAPAPMGFGALLAKIIKGIFK